MRKVRIACIQVGAGRDRNANLKKAEGLLAKAASGGARIACFPELTLQQFFPQYFGEEKFFKLAEPLAGKTVRAFREMAARYRIGVIPNIYERGESPGRRYDTSPVIDARGKLLGSQQMMHIARDPTEDEKFYYRPGERGFNVFSLEGLRIGVAICYDRHFPEHMRILALKGAQVIFVPAAATGLHRDAWEVEARASAVANGVFLAQVNKVGREGNLEFFGSSLIVGPRGEVTARASGEREEVLMGDIAPALADRTRDEWPFLRDRRPDTYGALTGVLPREVKGAPPRAKNRIPP